MLLLYILLLGLIATPVAALHKAETLTPEQRSLDIKQRLVAAAKAAADAFNNTEEILPGTRAFVQEQASRVLTQHAATPTSTPQKTQEPSNIDSEDDTEELGETESLDEPGAAADDQEVAEEPGSGDMQEEQEEQSLIEDHLFAPLFGDDEVPGALEKQVPPTPHSTPAKVKKKAAPKTAAKGKARQQKAELTAAPTTQAAAVGTGGEQKVTDQPKATTTTAAASATAVPLPAAATAATQQSAVQRTAQELPVAMPVNLALQEFSANFTRAARSSAAGMELANALSAELSAQGPSIETALSLFFNAWATTLHTTSQTLVTDEQAQLNRCTGGWIGGFLYSCYNPIWRQSIEQLARQQHNHTIQTELQAAAQQAMNSAKLHVGQTEAINKVIASISNRLAAPHALTNSPLAHQFVAIAEQQQRSNTSKISRFIVMNRKKAAIVALCAIVALGYIWRRRRQEY